VAQRKYVFSEGIFTAHNIRSLGAAAILEILIALGVAGILIWEQLHPAPPPPPIVTPAMEIPPNPPPPPPPPPNQPIKPDIPNPQPLSEVPPIPTPVPTPDAVPPSPPSPPPVPVQNPVNTANIEAEFMSACKAAIEQQALGHYPVDAIKQGETGTVKVSFDYVNGVVSNIKVDRSSGSRSLDRGATAAVQSASCPPKPAELAGVNHFIVDVLYTLGG